MFVVLIALQLVDLQLYGWRWWWVWERARTSCWTCVRVCERISLFIIAVLVAKQNTLIYMKHMYGRAYQANVYNWIECARNVHLCACGMLSYTVHLWFVRLCLCVYVCLYGFSYASGSCLYFLIQKLHTHTRYVSSNCWCTFYMCMLLFLLTLTVDAGSAGWRFCSSSSNSDQSKYKHSACTRCKQMLSKLTQAPKPVSIERREKEEEKTTENHIHLKRKIQIQWISAVAIHKSESYLLSVVVDWFNGICIDWLLFSRSIFVLLIWLTQWSSKFHFNG